MGFAKFVAAVTKGSKKVLWLLPGPAWAKITAPRTCDPFACSCWLTQLASSCRMLVLFDPPTRLMPRKSIPLLTKAKFSGLPLWRSVDGEHSQLLSKPRKYFTQYSHPCTGSTQSVVSLSPG